jgi:hypothetical protein
MLPDSLAEPADLGEEGVARKSFQVLIDHGPLTFVAWTSQKVCHFAPLLDTSHFPVIVRPSAPKVIVHRTCAGLSPICQSPERVQTPLFSSLCQP